MIRINRPPPAGPEPTAPATPPPEPPEAGVGEPCVACGDPPPPPRPTVKIRFSLFYDGTLNNRTNTEARINDGDARVGSYENDFSNVSKLETVWDDHGGVDHTFSVYVEGIGTFNNLDDSDYGAGTGMGDYGVKPKVLRGINEAIADIAGLGISDPVDFVHVDTFGFSRGAAAARYAVHVMMQKAGHTLHERLVRASLQMGTVAVKFVGLYDTVASYGVKHSNDTSDLSLDAISVAESVVQLAAAEEHRKNFRLTNINSAGGEELFLPGVHSDIGGGYTAPGSESGHILYKIRRFLTSSLKEPALVRERAWFEDKGWYADGQITEHTTRLYRELRGDRADIKNTYSTIPLQLMAEKAKAKGVNFSGRLTSEDGYKIPDELSLIKREIDKGIAAGRSASPDYYLNTTVGWMQLLRLQFLHVSAFYGATLGAHSPQFTGGSTIRGTRVRIIQDG